MPIYEFSCDKCGNVFEEIVAGDASVSCPKCGANQTHKLMSTCARRPRGDGDDLNFSSGSSSGGCGGCSGGNCSSCAH